MKIFQNAWFRRFIRKEKISVNMLCDAVERADNGQIDADLGGGVIKQRMARIGSGKSKGYRSIILRVLGTFFHMLITILFISFSTKKGDRFIFKTICFYNFIRLY